MRILYQMLEKSEIDVTDISLKGTNTTLPLEGTNSGAELQAGQKLEVVLEKLICKYLILKPEEGLFSSLGAL